MDFLVQQKHAYDSVLFQFASLGWHTETGPKTTTAQHWKAVEWFESKFSSLYCVIFQCLHTDYVYTRCNSCGCSEPSVFTGMPGTSAEAGSLNMVSRGLAKWVLVAVEVRWDNSGMEPAEGCSFWYVEGIRIIN